MNETLDIENSAVISDSTTPAQDQTEVTALTDTPTEATPIGTPTKAPAGATEEKKKVEYNYFADCDCDCS